MTEQLELNASESVWLVSAYQLTFAAFLLVVSLAHVVSTRIFF